MATPTPSVNRAMTRTIDINILFKRGKEIRFVNPFFKAWLLPREDKTNFRDLEPKAHIINRIPVMRLHEIFYQTFQFVIMFKPYLCIITIIKSPWYIRT